MKILFIGSEEELNKSIEEGETESSFSLSFCQLLPDEAQIIDLDAIVIPALKFLESSKKYFSIPVIVSGTALQAAPCLTANCTDFIREPWSFVELKARIEAKKIKDQKFGKLTLSKEGFLSNFEKTIRLSHSQYKILSLLIANAGRPVPKDAILCVLGTPQREGRAIDMQISRLRSILKSFVTNKTTEIIFCQNESYWLSKKDINSF